MTRFVILDTFRFIFAVIVAWGHFGGWGSPGKAYLAVDFFFVLSGFVLCFAYAGDRSQRPDFYKKFLVDRIARLYPLHFAMLILLVGVNVLFYYSTGKHLENGFSYQDGHAYTFGLNALLMHSVGLTTGGSWNAPSWSISVEFAVNLFLGLLIVHLALKKRYWPFLLAVSVFLYSALFQTIGNLGEIYERVFGFFNSGLVRGVAGISLGVVVYEVFTSVKDQTEHRILKVARLLWLPLSLMSLSTIFIIPNLQNVDFVAVPVIFFMVLFTALFEYSNPVRNTLVIRVLETLGALSYGIYMIHWPILTFIRYQLFYAWEVPVEFSSAAVTFSFVLGVCFLAVPIYYFFELPMKRLAKKWLTSTPATTKDQIGSNAIIDRRIAVPIQVLGRQENHAIK